jgi:hypothetical protein
MIQELVWDDLKVRRKIARLTYIYKAFTGESAYKELAERSEAKFIGNGHAMHII